uniref:UDP-galactose transporter n=1 Tax=Parascaris univalens TaxID=6257 RepID=A0A915CBZ6_PARUN
VVDANRRGSRERLVLHEPQELLPRRIPIRKPIVDRSSSHFLFRCYIIVSMTFIWTGYTIAVRYTRSTTPPAELYSSTTVVLMSEIVKLLITICFLFYMNNLNLLEFRKCISEEFIGKPLDLIKMSVPSIVYAIQNNLDFIALSNLDAGTYQVTAQLKVVTTAIFMMLILGRRFSFRRWVAIVWLFMGVAAVQMDAVEGQRDAKTAAENYWLGLMAVLLTCLTAGFADDAERWYEHSTVDSESANVQLWNGQCFCGVLLGRFQSHRFSWILPWIQL